MKHHIIYVGLDVHKDTIAVALPAESQRAKLRFCCEAKRSPSLHLPPALQPRSDPIRSDRKRLLRSRSENIANAGYGAPQSGGR